MGNRPHTRLMALAVFMAAALCVTPLAAQETVDDDGSTAVDWFPWKHVGLGAGFNLVRLNYDSDKKGELKVDYDYNGVLVYVTLVY